MRAVKTREQTRARRYVPTRTTAPRPFVAPPCARCGTKLCDEQNNPRWDVVGKLTFVCLDGCPPQALRRKAELS